MAYRTIIALAGAAISLLAQAATAEVTSSPRYQSWAKHKVGTSVSRTSESRQGSESVTIDLKQTLLEVTPEKVVVEMVVSVSMRGQVHKAKPVRVEFPAKAEKYTDLVTPDIKAAFIETRTESVEMFGQSLTCRVIEFTGTQTPRGGGKPINVKGTIWVSEGIPDATVQFMQTAETTDPEGRRLEAVTNTAVAAVDIKQ